MGKYVEHNGIKTRGAGDGHCLCATRGRIKHIRDCLISEFKFYLKLFHLRCTIQLYMMKLLAQCNLFIRGDRAHSICLSTMTSRPAREVFSRFFDSMFVAMQWSTMDFCGVLLHGFECTPPHKSAQSCDL